MVEVAWRYNSSTGSQFRQYYIDVDSIQKREENNFYDNYRYDIIYTYGYSDHNDLIGICFLNNNKLNLDFYEVRTNATVAVTKIVGIK